MCDDFVMWLGMYEMYGDVEVVWSVYGMMVLMLEGCFEDADVVRGVYEGGFKVWECVRDFVVYVGMVVFDVDGFVDVVGGWV